MALGSGLRCRAPKELNMEEVPHASRETIEAAVGGPPDPAAVGERMSVQHFHF